MHGTGTGGQGGGLVGSGLDGVMVDIEHYRGRPEPLTLLIASLRHVMGTWQPLSQLTFALSYLPNSQTAWYNHTALSEQLDYIFVMAYAHFGA